MPRSKRSTNASRKASATRHASTPACSRRRAMTDELRRLNMRETRSLGGEQAVNQEARVAPNPFAGGSCPLLERDLVGTRQAPHATLGEQLLVYCAEPAFERRVDGRAE